MIYWDKNRVKTAYRWRECTLDKTGRARNRAIQFPRLDSKRKRDYHDEGVHNAHATENNRPEAQPICDV